jgi:hypothetical protein
LVVSTSVANLPAPTPGTEVTRFNALKHGMLSRYTVLPWEDPEEYRALVDALTAEYAPSGPTQEHLVEEVAGIMWRKRRLRLAEAAAHRRGLEKSLKPYRETSKAALVHIEASTVSDGAADAVRKSDRETEEELADVATDEALTRQALELLSSSPQRNDAYELALATLREDTQAWWADKLARDPSEHEEDEVSATPDPDSLRRFIEAEVLPWFDRRRQELAVRPLIREQAFGEAVDPDKLEGLGRYEVHLDRKLERMLSMLLRLKDLKRGREEP